MYHYTDTFPEQVDLTLIALLCSGMCFVYCSMGPQHSAYIPLFGATANWTKNELYVALENDPGDYDLIPVPIEKSVQKILKAHKVVQQCSEKSSSLLCWIAASSSVSPCTERSILELIAPAQNKLS